MLKKVLTVILSILKHKEVFETAKEVWGIVDEKFRISETVDDVIKSKQTAFKKEMLKKYPEISDVDIEYYRQAVAGIINKDKPNRVTDNDLKVRIAELEKENADLKSKLSAVQNTIAPVNNN